MRSSRHRLDMSLYASVVCLSVFVLVSESRLSLNMYKPLAPILPSKNPCEICSEVVDCIRLDEAKCTYYEEASQLVYEELPPSRVDEELNEQVNGMLFDYIEEVLTDENTYDCIPFISKFTDCARDNICSGCNNCICDGDGQWNCSVVQRCTPSPASDINHLMLMAVIQNLKEHEEAPLARKKRDTNKGDSKKMSYEEVLNWWYEYTPPTFNSNENKIEDNKKEIENIHSKDIAPTRRIKPVNSEDDSNLVFAEVLNNIFTEDKIETGTEFSKMTNKKQFRKFIDFESNITFNNIYEMLIPFENNQDMPRSVTEGNSLKTESNTNSKYFVKDLLHMDQIVFNNSADVDLNLISNKKNIFKRSEPYYTTTNKYASHARFTKELFLIKKKDQDVKSERNRTVEENETLEDFRDNVVNPLSDVIYTKQLELEQLEKIRESLNKFMIRYSGGNYSRDVVPNITGVYNSSISIHAIETEDENGKLHDYRRMNVNLLEKYNSKLKHDIYVILKDIATIHKHSKHGVSANIRLLVRALRNFIRHTKLDNNERKKLGTFRRNMNREGKNSKKELIVKILELIDNDMPEVNALGPLADYAKKVIKRVIENNSIERGIKIGVNYDLNENLIYIGNDWSSLTAKVIHSSPSDQLYRLKLLHLNLSADIKKIVKALSVIDFIKTRRMMIPVDETEASIVMSSINKNLNNINRKIQVYFVNKENENSNMNDTKFPIEKRKKKKSFLKQITSLLKSSKRKVIDLMNRKVSKKDIIKEVAKTKLNEVTRRKLNEYEKTMKDWQNYFNVTVRSKRSVKEFNILENRLKNILPKYLRGKLKPAIGKRAKSKDQNKTKIKNGVTQNEVSTNHIVNEI